MHVLLSLTLCENCKNENLLLTNEGFSGEKS